MADAVRWINVTNGQVEKWRLRKGRILGQRVLDILKENECYWRYKTRQRYWSALVEFISEQ